MTTPIELPWPLQRGFEVATRSLFDLGDQSSADFLQPSGEAALVSPNSVSWRVFKNPVSLFVGGVAGVIMELAEPRVRTGIWEHTTFRIDPIRRLRRTGLAAMVTIYGARSVAEAMITRVRRMHDRVARSTRAGKVYRANDPELLNWVQSTAAYGFLQPYHEYVRPLSDVERDRYYAEGTLAASLYGASAPTSEAALEMRFEAMANQLERSDILFEFLAIMRSAPILPLPLRPVQPLLIRAAVDAVADVFSEIAKPDEKGDLIVTFPDAVQERCSANFRQRMNGQTLLYRALALTVGSDSAENIYWVSALIRVSQQLCHSENPVQMGR